MEELTQLREAWPQLQQSGVDTLALSVDGLDLQHDTGRADASRVADQLAFPFPWGIASEELIRKLSLLHTLLINQPPPLSVPMSFLVDADGSLVALYFGNVTPDTILTDVEASREASVDPRSMAAPYRGIWGTPPRTLMLSAMARTFREEGFEEDYKHYRSLDVERLTRLYSAAANEVEREALARRLADVHLRFGGGTSCCRSHGRGRPTLSFGDRRPSWSQQGPHQFGNAAATAGRAKGSHRSAKSRRQGPSSTHRGPSQPRTSAERGRTCLRGNPSFPQRHRTRNPTIGFVRPSHAL